MQFGGLVAVNRVSFDLHEAEILGIIGPNGAGKSTMFAAIGGSQPVAAGTVRFEGRRIDTLTPQAICRLGIARTFQLVRLFQSMTVMENVMVGALVRAGNVREARDIACEVVARLGLDPVAERAVTTIPLAQQKRTEIARALATRPKVILLDEMMTGLTAEETRQAVELVREMNGQGLTVVAVEHVLQVIRALCQRVVVLDHGTVIAEGSPAECMENPAVIEAYIGRRSDRGRKGG